MVKVLSIDGGGIRGVGPAYILTQLDAALSAKGKRLADCFDLFAGTSTGCILAAGLAAGDQTNPKLTTTDLFNLYYNRGAQMFVRTPLATPSFDLISGIYQTPKKYQVLQSILGTLTFNNLERNFLATYYSMTPGADAVFAQGGPRYRAVDDNNYAHVPIADAVNASSNAPIYFDPSAVSGDSQLAVDGGVFANNPSMCALVEAIKTWQTTLDKITVVSLGCGAIDR